MSRFTREEIFRKMDLWHTGVSKLPIHEFIGMTKREFDDFICEGKLP